MSNNQKAHHQAPSDLSLGVGGYENPFQDFASRSIRTRGLGRGGLPSSSSSVSLTCRGPLRLYQLGHGAILGGGAVVDERYGTLGYMPLPFTLLQLRYIEESKRSRWNPLDNNHSNFISQLRRVYDWTEGGFSASLSRLNFIQQLPNLHSSVLNCEVLSAASFSRYRISIHLTKYKPSKTKRPYIHLSTTCPS
jgi:hypothetical protein